MKQHQSTFGVAAQCRYFGVSRSGFYAWLNRKPSARLQWKQRLDQEVKQCFEQHKQRYGAQRIQRELLHSLNYRLIKIHYFIYPIELLYIFQCGLSR